MQIKIDTTPYANLETDALVSYVFDETDPIRALSPTSTNPLMDC